MAPHAQGAGVFAPHAQGMGVFALRAQGAGVFALGTQGAGVLAGRRNSAFSREARSRRSYGGREAGVLTADENEWTPPPPLRTISPAAIRNLGEWPLCGI
ncbi:hypothetical protein GCM10022420_093040 [Streptomyces iranensis]